MYYLIINCNYILVGGIKLYFYCLFVVKCEKYCIVLVEVVILGDKWFFLGIDLVLYIDLVKFQLCGCVGIFIVLNIMLCLVEVFEIVGKFKNFEVFVLLNGFVFYGLLVNDIIIIFIKGELVEYLVLIEIGVGIVIVFDFGFLLYWCVDV